ncbi:hypothetical protein ABFX02_02G116100 [Erythranthe guttata]
MEIISCHTTSCCYIVNLRATKFTDPHHSNRGKGFSSSLIKSSNFDHPYSLRLNRLAHYRPPNTVSSLNEAYNSNVLDGQVGTTSVTDRNNRSIPKVSIPSLPDKNGGDSAAPISSCYWEWRPKLNVHYEKSGSGNVDSPAVLFLPGFGVGSFHYEKQLKDLGRDYRTWAMDFLGQGMSLPNEDPTFRSDEYLLDGENDHWGFGDESETWAKELVYSADLWKDQVHYFVEEVIKEPVYLVGNSLGGFVALYFASCYPQLVKGVTLLNATPFWGLLPNPERSPILSRLFPWSGSFPLPSGIRKLMEILWLKISDPRSIAEILKQVYADHSTDVDEVFARIVETTQHPAAAASLASIMFAPKAQLSFEEALSRCQMNNIPICLMYGKEDPWVMPIFGLQVKNQMPDVPYYEISPAGHCPHDEVPEVVNFILRGWLKNVESEGRFVLPLLDDDPENANYDVTKDLEFFRQEGSRKSVRVKFHGSNFSVWNWFLSQFKSLLTEMSRLNT